MLIKIRESFLLAQFIETEKVALSSTGQMKKSVKKRDTSKSSEQVTPSIS